MMFFTHTIGGQSALTSMRRVAMDGAEGEFDALDLYGAWAGLGRRILVMAATVGNGVLTELNLTYFRRQQRTSIVTFENSDHFLGLLKLNKVCDPIWEFLNGGA